MAIPYMRKNSEENFGTIEVDPVSGEYYVKIPEWIVNDMGWYEDTELNISTDSDVMIITERD